MNKKLHEICKKEFQIAKINVRLLQNAKRFCKMQDAKCNCKIQNANDLVFKKISKKSFDNTNRKIWRIFEKLFLHNEKR